MRHSGTFIESAFNCIDTDSLNIHIINSDREHVKPIFDERITRATEFSAGYDLRVIDDTTVPAHSGKLVTFGDAIRIESGFFIGVVVPRSSLAKKRGLVLANGPYYIYNGMGNHLVSLKFINFTDNDVELKAGDKIAQCVFIKFPNWLISDDTEMAGVLQDEVIIQDDPLDAQIMSYPLESSIETVDGVSVDSVAKWSYSFQSPIDTVLEPGKVQCIMTGLRCKCNSDQVFILRCAVNNSCVELANCIGVVDSDYYDNPDNKGEIGVLLLNRGTQPVVIKQGDVIATGSIYNYGIVENDSFGGQRLGGFGSTDKH